MNRGAFAARNVQILVSSQTPGVTIDRGTVAVGDLPPQAEGAEQRIRLSIPQALGRDTPLESIAVIATWAQQEFAAGEKKIALPFRVQRPSLTATIVQSSPLVAGGPATFWLQLANEGELAAEGVAVEATSETEAVQLLGRVILTASSANELARERAALGHGFFTYYLLQGLDGQADEDGDGHIDVDEIYKFVSRSVIWETRGQQNPVKKAPSITGTVVVGRTSPRN